MKPIEPLHLTRGNWERIYIALDAHSFDGATDYVRAQARELMKTIGEWGKLAAQRGTRTGRK